MEPIIKNIDRKLRDLEIASIINNEELEQKLRNEIYKIVFTNDLNIWDEDVLLRLEKIIYSHPPNEKVYGEKVQVLRERTRKVRDINDLFYQIIEPEAVTENVIDGFSSVIELSKSVKESLCSDGRLNALRGDSLSPSEKILRFVHHVAKEAHSSSDTCLSDFESCVQAVREREQLGTAKALLVYKRANKGLQIPVSVKVQNGRGQVETMTPAAETFTEAVKRARSALVDEHFITPSQDVLLTLNLTEAEYSGSSIALGAAMAIYSSARGYCLDTYTAYTGDINLQGQEWDIQSVEGIEAKLRAAMESGCRRVFIPRDNESDTPPELREKLHVIPVSNIAEILVLLFLPRTGTPGETLQVRKIRRLHAECTDRGWQISEPKGIQSGVQFTVSPPAPPELKMNIYQTGTHVPSQGDTPQFQSIISALGELDVQRLTPQSIQRVFLLKDAELRSEIRSALQDFSPAETKNEQHCEYSFRFEEGAENLVIKQFISGKLQIQGRAGELYKLVLEVIVSKFKLHYPKMEMDVGSILLESGFAVSNTQTSTEAEPPPRRDEEEFPLPYIGIDESGKGDYFGPLVVTAVWLNESIQKKLEAMGVRDSKKLSDKKCQELAVVIRELCRGKFAYTEIGPKRYNSLYEQFKSEGKNLNHLLAWGHARSLENLLNEQQSQYAVADQFGDEKYIKSKLMEKGRALLLAQTPKAERYMAVAAASILARDIFLTRLEQLGKQLGMTLPKGASQAVEEVARIIVKKGGAEALGSFAKLHFKTTNKVVGKQ